MHLNGVELFKKYAKGYFHDGIRVLEIAPFGCYQEMTKNIIVEWWSLSIGSSKLFDDKKRIVISDKEYEYPFPDNYFDIVLSDQVISHVQLFWVWMAELKRIVKTNGLIITIGALSYPYAPSPLDCWRIYPDGMIALNEYVGLETIISRTDSLELEHFGYSKKYKSIPNFRVYAESIASTNTLKPKILFHNRIKIVYNTILMRLPMIRRFMNPIKIAADTITVARKKEMRLS